MHLRRLFIEFNVNHPTADIKKPQTELHTDITLAISHIEKHIITELSKHLYIKAHHIKQLV